MTCMCTNVLGRQAKRKVACWHSPAKMLPPPRTSRCRTHPSAVEGSPTTSIDPVLLWAPTPNSRPYEHAHSPTAAPYAGISGTVGAVWHRLWGWWQARSPTTLSFSGCTRALDHARDGKNQAGTLEWCRHLPVHAAPDDRFSANVTQQLRVSVLPAERPTDSPLRSRQRRAWMVRLYRCHPHFWQQFPPARVPRTHRRPSRRPACVGSAATMPLQNLETSLNSGRVCMVAETMRLK